MGRKILMVGLMPALAGRLVMMLVPARKLAVMIILAVIIILALARKLVIVGVILVNFSYQRGRSRLG
jgi:hypothetical protein